MAQKAIREQTHFIDSEEDLIRLFYTPGVKVKDITIASDDKLIVLTELEKEVASESKYSNKVLASFVTAYGRIMLFKACNRLQRRILYMDTGT